MAGVNFTLVTKVLMPGSKFNLCAASIPKSAGWANSAIASAGKSAGKPNSTRRRTQFPAANSAALLYADITSLA
jgi:hypothetical protein